MPFDKLKAPSTVEGLRVDTERRFLPQPEGWGLPSTRAQAEGAPSNVSMFKEEGRVSFEGKNQQYYMQGISLIN